MGLVLGILGILLIGYLVSKESVQRVFHLVEMPFTNLPVVKSIYSSLKSFADYFRPEEHTSELQSLMRISYAVFSLKKKNKTSKQRQLNILPQPEQYTVNQRRD